MSIGPVTRSQFKVSDFIGWQKAGLLVLSPKFQRRPVWSAGAKSYLIDSIIQGFPIPIIFLRERKTDLKRLIHEREVVDGQQRIRTIISFISPELLPDFRPSRDYFQVKEVHNKDLADKDFGELPKEVRQAILDYEFSVHTLSSSVDDREVLQVFARMNATGYKLNPQELRNAKWFGYFKTCMFQLAAEQLSRWRDWRIFSEDNIARMDEVELTSEFAQLMVSGIVGKSQASLNTLYLRRDLHFPERAEIKRRFRAVMDRIDSTLRQSIATSQFRKRAPFYALFALLYDASYGTGSPLKRSAPSRLPSSLEENLLRASQRLRSGRAPTSVMDSLARRTTHPESRRRLIKYLRKICNLG